MKLAFSFSAACCLAFGLVILLSASVAIANNVAQNPKTSPLADLPSDEAETFWSEAQSELSALDSNGAGTHGLSAKAAAKIESAMVLLERAVDSRSQSIKFRLGLARAQLALLQHSSQAQLEATRHLEIAFSRAFGFSTVNIDSASSSDSAHSNADSLSPFLLEMKTLIDGLPAALHAVFARDVDAAIHIDADTNTNTPTTATTASARRSVPLSDAFGFPPSDYPLSPHWSTLNQSRWLIVHSLCEAYSRKQIYNTYGLFSALKLLSWFSITVQPPVSLRVLEERKVISHFGFVATAVGSYFDMIWARIHAKMATNSDTRQSTQAQAQTQTQTQTQRERMHLSWETSLLSLTSALDRYVIQLSTMGFSNSMYNIQLALRYSCELGRNQSPTHGQWNYSKSAWGAVASLCLKANDVVNRLHSLGANPNVQLANGMRPLHLAAIAGDAALVESLLSVGGEKDAVDNQRQSALHVAILYDSTAAAAVLLRAGADHADVDAYSRSVDAMVRARCRFWSMDAVERSFLEALRSVRSSANDGQEHDDLHAYCTTLSSQHRNRPRLPLDLDNDNQQQSQNADVGCDIAVLHRFTAEHFVREYMSLHLPVLVRDVISDPSDAAAWQKTLKALSRKKLLSRYGNAMVTVSGIPYAKSFGDEREQKMTLREYVEYLDKQKALPASERDKDPDYIFQAPRNDYALRSAAEPDATTNKQKGKNAGLESLVDHFYVPSVVDTRITNLTTHRRAPQFYFGPKHSGAPIHYHNPAINVLLSGRKRWFLWPPSSAVYSRKHAHAWFREDYPNLKEHERPLECIQEAGDMVFVPDLWGHAVLNIDECIGFALETDHARVVKFV